MIVHVAPGEQHVYPLSLIASPRAVELTTIEDDFCLPLAFSAALFVCGLHLVHSDFTSVNLQFIKLEQRTYGPWAKA